MPVTFTLFPVPETPGAFGYIVESATTRVVQPFVPGAGGQQPMTEAQATAYAQALVAELTAPAPSPSPEA